jgi:hypothetical protein
LANFPGGGRINVAGFVIGDTIYVGTGWDGNGVTNTFWGYERNSNSWTSISPFPGLARNNAIAFAMGGKGFVGTGVTGPGHTFTSGFAADFYSYEPLTGTWSQIADYPAGKLDAVSAFTINDTSYLIAGNDSGTPVKFVYKYGPQLANGIDEAAELNAKIQVYPNPASDVLKVATKSEKPFEVFVYSLNGSVVRQEKNLGTTLSLNISDLAAGEYIVVVKSAGQTTNTKFIKL